MVEEGRVVAKWTYGPSCHVKTWEKPQDRTWDSACFSASLIEGMIACGVLEWLLKVNYRFFLGDLDS